MPANLFFDTDFVTVVPKWTMQYGVRGLTGASTKFGGTGFVQSVQGQGEFTDKGIARTYHDGAVGVDARRASIDDGLGHVTNVPVTPDGRTDTWSYKTADQALSNGTIAMHTYTNAIADSGGRSKKSDTGYGMEISFRRTTDRAIGKFGFDLLGGIGLNSINANLSSKETSTTTTLTDTYSLNGQDAPAAPYSAPSSVSAPLVDANGRPFIGSDGTAQSNTRDTTVMLNQDPSERTSTSSTDSTSVTNRYHLKGAYFTFRAGPSLSLPIGERFRATVSAGAALVYAGTTYTVLQDFTPPTGELITSGVERSEANFLPGLYADANLEMTLTERAGAFLGVAYQNSGSFDQGIKEGNVNYGTKVKLSNLTGIRMGLNVRF
jgi:hypothetical protein